MALLDRLRELVSDSCIAPVITTSLVANDNATWLAKAYSISVSSVTKFGETVPCTAVSVTCESNKSVVVTINRVENAEYYRVYVDNVLAYTATQSQADTVVVTLTGPPSSGSAAPTANTAGVYLSISAYTNCVNSALQEYATRRPLETSDDLTVVTAGQEQSLPADWVEGFSHITKLEYPIDQLPPVYLEESEDYMVKGGSLYFDFSLVVGDNYRVYYTIEREESDIPTSDVEAVALLAASKACSMIAVGYTHMMNKVIGADTVNYGARSSGFKELAKEFRKQYEEMIPGAASSAAVVNYYDQHGVL